VRGGVATRYSCRALPRTGVARVPGPPENESPTCEANWQGKPPAGAVQPAAARPGRSSGPAGHQPSPFPAQRAGDFSRAAGRRRRARRTRQAPNTPR
jgi:hypothetical protein